MEQITFEEWFEKLSDEDKATLTPVWQDHIEKFTANPTYTPQSDEFSAMWNRYTADTTI